MSSRTPDLSVADKLVIAAAALDEQTGAFTAEDLVVEAWQQFPETFGLRGHLDDSNQPRFPDSNRVFAEIMGNHTVRKNGWIEKVGNKRYRLSDVGRQRAYEVTGRSSTRKMVLDRAATDRVRKLLNSRAMLKRRENREESITFLDACSLWGINPRSNLKELVQKFADFDRLLDVVEQAVGDREFVLRHGETPYTAVDVTDLRNLSEALRTRFSGEIATIRERRTER